MTSPFTGVLLAVKGRIQSSTETHFSLRFRLAVQTVNKLVEFLVREEATLIASVVVSLKAIKPSARRGASIRDLLQFLSRILR
jgi:hypothetical protein